MKLLGFLIIAFVVSNMFEDNPNTIALLTPMDLFLFFTLMWYGMVDLFQSHKN